MKLNMKKKHKRIFLLMVLSTIFVLIGSSYAYFAVIFKDERTSDDNGSTNIKTCGIAEATTISDIPDSIGSFTETNIYPGHKEVLGMKVSASGSVGSTSSFKIKYKVEENGLGENVKVSVYQSDEPIEVTENFFECQKTSSKKENETILYETCKEKEIGTLLQETILGSDEREVVIGKDTLVVRNSNQEKERYYYVVVEFINQEESQNSIMNTSLKGHVEIELTAEKSLYTECILNGADPVLKDELIPVTIDDNGTVHVADIKKEWYNYGEQRWANAIILNDENTRNQYTDIIPESAIESYFVWIPKYRYQLWDLGEYDGLTEIDETKVHTIPLIFGDYNTSDEVSGECTTPMTSGDSGNCKVGDYMTHPAFLSIPSTGFWVGKFETSKGNSNADNSINPDGVQIKPNVVSWRNIQVANAFYSSYDYKRNLDSHMMKNTEWGAVAYLQHSEYGSHTSVRFNNNSNYITGYSSITEPTCGYPQNNQLCNRYGTTSDITLPYNTSTGYLASTTGNISGIYDMSGGSWEYIMGVIADTNGNVLTGSNSGSHSNFNGNYGLGGSLSNALSLPNSKYYDIYKNRNYVNNYSKGHIGDAMGEIGPFESTSSSSSMSSWYNNYANSAYTIYPWFVRGGIYTLGLSSGIFAFSYTSGGWYQHGSFRLVLTPTL